MKSGSFVAAMIASGCLLVISQAYAQETPQSLFIRYEGSTAEPYTVQIQPGGKYTVSQAYSWVRDETSRYSLVSYSLNEGADVEIPRKSRGNFLLDVAAGSVHTVTFRASVQYPLSATADNDNLLVTFSPSSPTGDSWFDAGSAISITVSNREQTPSPTSRQQITSWSIDNSKRVVESSGPTFTTPAIQVATPHQVKFASITQHYVQVLTSHGTASGAGWYDAGSMASINVQNDEEFLLPHNFAGWDDGKGAILEQSSQSFLVDSPVTLTAKWSTDYSRLVGIVVLPVAATLVVVMMLRFRTNKRSQSKTTATTVQSHKQDRTSEQAALQEHGNDIPAPDARENKYSSEVAAYSVKKSIEKLQALQSSGLISDARLSKIKEKLEGSLE